MRIQHPVDSLSRRAFLSRAGQAGLALTPWASACARPDEITPDDDGAPRGPGAGASDPSGLASVEPLTRPVLRSWSDGMVWMDAPPPELPVAYVSMALRQVFVDRDYRDRASWLLDAHISVSTWHWRIRLPGDSPTEPISPGDALREFEELDIREWDPSMIPAMDDIRIRRGSRVRRTIEFSCVPGTEAAGPRHAPGGATTSPSMRDAWYRGGPWDTVIVGGPSEDDETEREDFHVVGTGSRFRDQSCSGDGEVVQCLTWAVR